MAKITKDMNIMDIVQACPESIAVFQKYGLEKDIFFEESFKILYHRHKKFFDSIVVEKK